MARLQTELQKKTLLLTLWALLILPEAAVVVANSWTAQRARDTSFTCMPPPPPPPVLIEKTEHWSSYGSELPDSLCGKFPNITLRNFRRVLILKWSEAQIFASLG